MTFKLKWVDGDWKVDELHPEGRPRTRRRRQPASTADEIAEAVEEYGGFTYAR